MLVLPCFLQEGAEVEEDDAAEDIPDALEGEGEEKQEQEGVERPRKTSKYMTKYERARILGTRALQIRFAFLGFFEFLACANLFFLR